MVKVDANKCIRSGMCASTTPDLFELDENSKSRPKNGGRVPAELADIAQDVVDFCPAEAISISPAE
ncbi:ferredoxin [Amycolatopsis sp. NPDC049868]|uniref:ferredoxin n=1 Tax=Amycolatopsis sp. NPDC049868 TaxID=3363934 RepID=UPI00379057D6